FFFSGRRRHTRFSRDWSSDVCSSDLPVDAGTEAAWIGQFDLHEVNLRMSGLSWQCLESLIQLSVEGEQFDVMNYRCCADDRIGQIGRASCSVRIGLVIADSALCS